MIKAEYNILNDRQRQVYEELHVLDSEILLDLILNFTGEQFLDDKDFIEYLKGLGYLGEDEENNVDVLRELDTQKLIQINTEYQRVFDYVIFSFDRKEADLSTHISKISNTYRIGDVNDNYTEYLFEIGDVEYKVYEDKLTGMLELASLITFEVSVNDFVTCSIEDVRNVIRGRNKE